MKARKKSPKKLEPKQSGSLKKLSGKQGIQLGQESMKDGLVQLMLRKGVPLTRENYIRAAGLSEPLDSELEADLPEEFQATKRAEKSQIRLTSRPSLMR